MLRISTQSECWLWQCGVAWVRKTLSLRANRDTNTWEIRAIGHTANKPNYFTSRLVESYLANDFNKYCVHCKSNTRISSKQRYAKLLRTVLTNITSVAVKILKNQNKPKTLNVTWLGSPLYCMPLISTGGVTYHVTDKRWRRGALLLADKRWRRDNTVGSNQELTHLLFSMSF